MISLKSKITQAVLGYFFVHPEAELYVNQLARKLNLDSGNLTRKLIELDRSGILKSRWQGDQRHYSLNMSFSLFSQYQDIIMQTIGLEHTLRQQLKPISGIQHACLFGSYARNQMDQISDIDLLVVGNHNTLDVQRSIAKIQKNISREINVISMSAQEFNDRKDSDPLVQSIQKGKVISII